MYVNSARRAAEPQLGAVRLLKFTFLSFYFILRNHSQNQLKLHNAFFDPLMSKIRQKCSVHKHYGYTPKVKETDSFSSTGWWWKIRMNGCYPKVIGKFILGLLQFVFISLLENHLNEYMIFKYKSVWCDFWLANLRFLIFKFLLSFPRFIILLLLREKLGNLTECRTIK